MRRRPGRGLRRPDRGGGGAVPAAGLPSTCPSTTRWVSLDAGQAAAAHARRREVSRDLPCGEVALPLPMIEDALIDDETEAVLDAPWRARVAVARACPRDLPAGMATRMGEQNVLQPGQPLPAAGPTPRCALGRVAAVRQLIKRTEGNPFFLERRSQPGGASRPAGGAGRTPGETPSSRTPGVRRSPRASIASSEDKQVLQAASAIGKDVPRCLMAAADIPETSAGRPRPAPGARACNEIQPRPGTRTPSRTRSPRRSRMPVPVRDCRRCTRGS